MIISASRRTDIPCYGADWFMKQLKEGFVEVTNPFNSAQKRLVSLRPEDVDGFVFWTKDPENLLPHLDTLDREGYAYYFQFTLTPYGREWEKRLREKRALLETFLSLSERIGRERVLWRYDPIFLTENIGIANHMRAFENMASALCTATEKVSISFIDLYPRLAGRGFRPVREDEMHAIADGFSRIARERNLSIASCCDMIDLSKYGFEHATCVDGARLSRISGRRIASTHDKNQRKGCTCTKSVDIGRYNTCKNGCLYCYAVNNP